MVVSWFPLCWSAFTMVFSRLEKDGFLPKAEFLSKKLLNVTSLGFHWRVYRHTLAEDEPSSDAIAPIIIAAVEKPVATLLSWRRKVHLENIFSQEFSNALMLNCATTTTQNPKPGLLRKKDLFITCHWIPCQFLSSRKCLLFILIWAVMQNWNVQGFFGGTSFIKIKWYIV